MIFYFTGTGNSLFVAKEIVSDGELLIDMAKCVQNNEFSFDVQGEALGFVMPTYFYSVPMVVRDFIAKADFCNTSYIYGVFTCGGGMGQAGSMFKALLKEKGLKLDYVKEVLMPDNSMLFYQIPGKDDGRIDKAAVLCADIREDVAKRAVLRISDNYVLTKVLDVGYQLCRGTKKFWVSDECVGCGLCVANCPERVIELRNGKPVWLKDKCGKCSACINRCPKGAIEYGAMTKRRNRYRNERVF